ncbi:hypothetical protein Tco_0511369 [Tanacetum coccineum]
MVGRKGAALRWGGALGAGGRGVCVECLVGVGGGVLELASLVGGEWGSGGVGCGWCGEVVGGEGLGFVRVGGGGGLEEQMNEEQRAQIARDEEIARQWDEEERKRAMDAAKSTKKIDWNDPSVIRYHSLKMKPKTIAQARRNMIKYLKNQGNYKSKEVKKQKSPEKERSTEKIVEEEAVTQGEREEVVKEPAAKRKKSIPRKTTRKRQKLEEDAEKDELKGFLDIVPREEAPIEVESLSTKFPIVDWKTCVLTETFMYYQVFRGDGSSKNYKVLSEMLEDFDRMDVEELFRLVKERYSTSAPEGFDLMLWGDLHTLFEPDKDDEIWRDQHEYNLLSWRLCDFCGIHILLMDNGLAIHMLTEKKYPLSQEMLRCCQRCWLRLEIMPPRKAPRTRTTPATTTNTTSVTNAQLQAMIDQGVAAALATRDANRSTNGEDSHNSGTGVRRTERVARECTYQDFMKCQPLFFKGTEGVVKLTQWFERMETVFRISNCTVENQIKFSTCTLLGVALTWWNSHVRTVGHDVAYAMTWTDLKKKMTDKYCPRSEIKKLEVVDL